MNSNKNRRIAKLIASASLMCLLHQPIAATGIKPEKTAVILNEEQGEVTVQISNTDQSPVLLYSTIEDVPEDIASPVLVIVTPPVARLEPGESQLVRFILQMQQHEQLQFEQYKRVAFEGIPQQVANQSNQLRFHIRQRLPFIIRPKNLPACRTPWQFLVWSIDQEQRLHIDNTSPYVIRLTSVLHLLPGQLTRSLDRTYILPHEKITVQSPLSATQENIQKIIIYPVAADGSPADPYIVRHKQTDNLIKH